ncbi:putative ribonuclease H-like domain-containing protein [Tanacetum coccineum]
MKKKCCLVVTDDYSRFTWVFFLANKDETSGILKSFITGIENLVDHKVKVIRCDNETEFKNREMNQFCEKKGILRQYSVARTPQQNGVAERRNMTLIEAAKTMLADSKLPTIFWAEAVNTTCYVQNKVTPTLSFMRPFGCLVTILNTVDHLGKFDGKADEGFFVGYSLNSKAFKVFNSKTRIVEENLHIRFSESTPNVIGSGPDWLFDIDALTRTMNYKPIVTGTQSNGFAGTKASDNAGQARKEIEPVKNYILLPFDDDKKVDEDPRKDSESIDQEKDDNVNSTNNVNAASTNEVNVISGKTSIELPDDPNMHALEDISIFDLSRDNEDVDHPLNQVIGDLQSATQTRNMSRNLEEHGLVAQGYTQEEGIYYDEVFAPVARIEAIRLFLAYALFKDFVVYQMNVKSAFLYEKIEEEVYDEDGEEVDVHMYRSMIGSLMYFTSSRPDIMFAVCACARYQVNPKVSHLYPVKRIFRYLKGQPKLGLWYPKDFPFDLVAYTDSDYAEASLDRKSKIGGCQFLGSRLISWQCKKPTVVANSTTEAEYVAALSCCGQVLWI